MPHSTFYDWGSQNGVIMTLTTTWEKQNGVGLQEAAEDRTDELLKIYQREISGALGSCKAGEKGAASCSQWTRTLLADHGLEGFLLALTDQESGVFYCSPTSSSSVAEARKKGSEYVWSTYESQSLFEKTSAQARGILHGLSNILHNMPEFGARFEIMYNALGKNVSRRDFLKISAVTGAALATMGSDCPDDPSPYVSTAGDGELFIQHGSSLIDTAIAINYLEVEAMQRMYFQHKTAAREAYKSMATDNPNLPFPGVITDEVDEALNGLVALYLDAHHTGQINLNNLDPDYIKNTLFSAINTKACNTAWNDVSYENQMRGPLLARALMIGLGIWIPPVGDGIDALETLTGEIWHKDLLGYDMTAEDRIINMLALAAVSEMTPPDMVDNAYDFSRIINNSRDRAKLVYLGSEAADDARLFIRHEGSVRAFKLVDKHLEEIAENFTENDFFKAYDAALSRSQESYKAAEVGFGRQLGSVNMLGEVGTPTAVFHFEGDLTHFNTAFGSTKNISTLVNKIDPIGTNIAYLRQVGNLETVAEKMDMVYMYLPWGDGTAMLLDPTMVRNASQSTEIRGVLTGDSIGDLMRSPGHADAKAFFYGQVFDPNNFLGQSFLRQLSDYDARMGTSLSKLWDPSFSGDIKKIEEAFETTYESIRKFEPGSGGKVIRSYDDSYIALRDSFASLYPSYLKNVVGIPADRIVAQAGSAWSLKKMTLFGNSIAMGGDQALYFTIKSGN
jgi:hypothetical protein